MDYSPSPEAVTICGFDEPAAEVEVSYRTEAGTEQTMTLSVGTASLDGTGRYVRLNDDTAIYQLAADGVDTLVPGGPPKAFRFKTFFDGGKGG